MATGSHHTTEIALGLKACRAQVLPGEMCLSFLPPWHIYERTVAYYLLSRGGQLVHTSVKRLKQDLARLRPDYLVCVPLLLTTLHSRVMATLHKLEGVKGELVRMLLKQAETHVKACCPSPCRLFCTVKAPCCGELACPAPLAPLLLHRRSGHMLCALQAKRVLNNVALELAFGGDGPTARFKAMLLAWLTAIPNLLAQLLIFRKIRAVRSLPEHCFMQSCGVLLPQPLPRWPAAALSRDVPWHARLPLCPTC